MALVEFQNVTKTFAGVPVLDGLSFTVEKGEILCIAGPSGTGKSVTLKHLVRLLTPTSGTVLFDGVDVSECSDAELSAVRDRIGYLFQGGALLAWMTVAENVALPLQECTDMPDAEIDRRVSAALEAVELADAAGKYPAEISGGMQKRAGLARAIVRESDVILYDEPTSGLDPVTSATINNLIRKLNKKLGITSVVVTHDLQGALAIADRILLLKNGRVAECSRPADFVRSGNGDVKEFLAAMKGEML
ncbi:MAG: ATP-binding cassette domain-containing protein [Kiritimatiellae bacterium]|nr:ATP-binding cassette domain-containing protein [Kiritimatiellia bacterium]